MDDLEFCPFCNEASHKIVPCKEETFFCRSCNRFFDLKQIKYTCFKCGGSNIKDSDFPAPDGDLVFQSSSCKKMYSKKEFFEKLEKIKEFEKNN